MPSNKKLIKTDSAQSEKKIPKIQSLTELAVIINGERRNDQKIIQAHGVFDLLHVGHIRHLEQAKELGDILVVTITPDCYVNKGPHRPAFTQKTRAHALAALESVDYIAITESPTSVEAIELLKPNIFVKGTEFKELRDITGAVTREAQTIKSVGGEIKFVGDITHSSSTLLNKHFRTLSEAQEKFLECIREKYPLDEILEWMEKIAQLKPVVVGEAVIEEYLFCHAMGQSIKDPVLSVQEDSSEIFAGGSMAISNVLAGFCDEIVLITQLGELRRKDKIARNRLRPQIKPVFLIKENSPTIYKRRIVDMYSGNKLLEVYDLDDSMASEENVVELNRAIVNQTRNKPDLVIVSDHGHGMLNKKTTRVLCDNAPFLALSIQCNTANRGYNTIDKYKRADYVCISGHELNLEVKEKEINDQERVSKLSQLIDCKKFTVTLGKMGTLHHEWPDHMHQIPAMAYRVLDRVGAGDVCLAVTSLLVRSNAPWDIVGLYGNAAAAIHVSDLGNRNPVDRITLGRYLTSLLK